MTGFLSITLIETFQSWDGREYIDMITCSGMECSFYRAIGHKIRDWTYSRGIVRLLFRLSLNASHFQSDKGYSLNCLRKNSWVLETDAILKFWKIFIPNYHRWSKLKLNNTLFGYHAILFILLVHKCENQVCPCMKFADSSSSLSSTMLPDQPKYDNLLEDIQYIVNNDKLKYKHTLSYIIVSRSRKLKKCHKEGLRFRINEIWMFTYQQLFPANNTYNLHFIRLLNFHFDILILYHHYHDFIRFCDLHLNWKNEYE